MSTSLSERVAQFRDVLDFDVDDEDDAEALIQLLDESKDAFDEKAKRVAYMVMQFAREAGVLREEEKRLAERRKVRENKVERLREYLKYCMEGVGITKIEDERVTIRLQRNAPSVRLLDEKAIPKQYWEPQPDRLDKRGVLDALKAGRKVPGAELQQTESVRIK